MAKPHKVVHKILNDKDNDWTGTSKADWVNGKGGDDTLSGGAGNDTIKGGTGDDIIRGGADDDRLDGGAGNDRLLGGGGDDTIIAKSGNDIVDGGTGDDIVQIKGNFADATVVMDGDYFAITIGSQTTKVKNVELFKFSDGTVDASDVADKIVTVDPDMTIKLTAGVDTAAGKGGNDTIVGNNDANNALTYTSFDNIDGGDGTDTLSIVLSGVAIDTTAAVNTTVANVEKVVLQSTMTVKADTSAWAGVTDLTVASVGGATLTAATTTDIIVTDTSLAAGAIAVNGGNDVTVTGQGGTGGTITVGGTTAPTGAVNVTESGAAAGGTTMGAINVKGGTTVTVTVSETAVDNLVDTQSNVTVTGTADTTAVTVSQTAAQTDNNVDVVGTIVNGTVTINDVNAASTTAAGTITTVTLSSYGASTIDSSALTTVNLSGTGGTLGIGRGNLAATPTANDLTLNISGLTAGAITDSEAAADDGFTTINIVAAGAASTIAGLVAADATTLNISGSSAVTLSSIAGSTALTAINVTDTAGVTIGTELLTTTAFTGGAGADSILIGATTKTITMGDGDDTVTFSQAAFGSGGSVDAGNGTDTLAMTGANAATASASATFESTIAGFERLSLDASTATVNLANLDDINYVTVAAASSYTLTGAATGFTLVANAGAGATSVALASDGTADVINVDISAASAQTIAGLTATGFETVNFVTDESDTTSGIAHVVALTDATAKTITISGDAGLNLGTFTGGVNLTTFDASGVTAGAVTLTTAALTSAAVLTGGAGDDALNASAAVATVTIDGGAGADTIAGSSTIGSVLTGGAGNDVITGGAGADTISGGDGTDTFAFGSLPTQVGAGSVDGAIINLSSATITSSEVFTATGGEFLASSQTGVASGSATILYGSESNTNPSVVDTLSSIENVTGSSGADYIIGSSAANVINGGAGDDWIVGGLGGDTLNGDADNDTFVFNTAVADSRGANGNITGIDTVTATVNAATADLFDLDVTVANVNTAIGAATVNAATFVTDLATALNVGGGAGFNTVVAGDISAAVVTVAAGDLIGHKYLAVDVNHNDTFDATDFVIDVTAATLTSLTTASFI